VDQIKSQVDNLSELSDEAIAELQTAIISEFETVETQDPTAETVDAMTSLADMLDTVRGESKRREAAAEELAARASEAAMRVKGEDVPVEEEMLPAEETPAEAPTESPEPSEDEAEETPKEEMEMGDMKKKKDGEMEYSSETETASIESVEATELSIATTESIELSVEESPELSTEEVGEIATSEEPAGEEPVAETVTEEAPIVADASEEVVEVVVEESIEPETPIAPEEQEEQAPVTTPAEQSFEAPADRQPVVQVVEAAPVAITAGADIPGYTAGSTINDMYEVASAMEKRIHSLRRVNGGDGEQHIVASVTTAYPESRVLSTDAESNMAKINAVSGAQALVASGGHAAPFEVKYDIYSIGSTTVRPVRDALPRFQADRGGIRFVTPPTFASGDYANAVGVWTAATDALPYANVKTSLTVTAAGENTVSTDAVTLQLQFGNLMTRAYPELIARHNELGLVQHAREAEDNLLAKISAGSTAVTTSNLIGFGRDFLVQVRRAATAYRSRHRIDPQSRLKLIIPNWVYDAMAADLALAMPGDGTLSVSKSEIDGYLGNLNVDVVAHYDDSSANGVFGAQSAAALLEFPDTFKWYLFAEGTFLFLDGGTLDLGIIRDSTLVGTNDYKMFIETFENVAKVGIESLAVTSTINVNGVAAALRDTTGGTAAATIEL
jgi:chemotaxis protein histidine kinase CheA